eukprot:jgi/Phyca11/19684/fgenesh1_pg.PHYCAscaffold_51_\
MLPAGGVATTAAQASRSAARVAVEHHVHAEPDQSQAPTARVRVEPMQVDATSSSDDEELEAGDDGPAPMLVDDQGRPAAATADTTVDTGWCTPWSRPPSPPTLRVGVKRRRMDDGDDEDMQVLAELLAEEEDQAGAQAPALRLSAASAHPASVLSVYVHNASRFECTLCTYTAASFASLNRHRDTRHRRTAFLDRFSAGCACGTPFASRLAAARHAQACASLITTSVAASTIGGASSHTVVGANTTVTTAVTGETRPAPILSLGTHSVPPT